MSNGTWWALGAIGALGAGSRLARGSRAWEELKKYHFDKGDIIVPRGRVYPDGALEVRTWDGETLEAYPVGGGFSLRLPPDRVAFHDFEVVVPARPSLRRLPKSTEPQWRKAFFFLDDPEAGVYEGYHWGQRWNGWAVPHFTKDVIKKALENMTSKDFGVYGVFDENNDRVCLFNLYELEEEAQRRWTIENPPLPPPGPVEYHEDFPWDCSEGRRQERDGIPLMTLYTFGSGWIWDDISEEEIEPEWIK